MDEVEYVEDWADRRQRRSEQPWSSFGLTLANSSSTAVLSPNLSDQSPISPVSPSPTRTPPLPSPLTSEGDTGNVDDPSLYAIPPASTTPTPCHTTMALTELEEDLLQYLTNHHVAAFESALERAQANLDLEAVGGDPLHPIPRLDIHLALDPSTAADYSPLLGHLLTHYAGTPYFNPHMPSTLGRQCYRYLLRACFRYLQRRLAGPEPVPGPGPARHWIILPEQIHIVVQPTHVPSLPAYQIPPPLPDGTGGLRAFRIPLFQTAQRLLLLSRVEISRVYRPTLRPTPRTWECRRNPRCRNRYYMHFRPFGPPPYTIHRSAGAHYRVTGSSGWSLPSSYPPVPPAPTPADLVCPHCKAALIETHKPETLPYEQRIWLKDRSGPGTTLGGLATNSYGIRYTVEAILPHYLVGHVRLGQRVRLIVSVDHNSAESPLERKMQQPWVDIRGGGHQSRSGDGGGTYTPAVRVLVWSLTDQSDGRDPIRTLSDYSLGPQLPYYYHHHHHPLGNPTDSAHTIRTILFHHVRSLFHRFTAHSLHSAFPNSDRGLKTGMLASTPNSESPPPLPLAGETLLASLVSIVPVPPSGEPVLPTDHEEEEEEGGTTPTKTGACLHVGILTSFHSYGAVVHTLRTLAHQLSRWGSWVVVSGQSTGRVPQRKYFESSNGAEYLEDPCLGDASDGVLLVDEASALPPAQLIMLDRLLQHNLAAVQVRRSPDPFPRQHALTVQGTCVIWRVIPTQAFHLGQRRRKQKESFPEVATPDYSQRVAELAHYLAHCRQVAVHTVDGRVLSAPLSTSSSPTCPGHPSPSPVDSRLLLSRYFDRFRAWQRKHPYVLESGSRVLITLTKLTQAHAKLHLRTVPQVEDALFSVRVMEATLTVKYRACVCSQGGLDWLISD
ncbi:hypothetical protein H4R33_005378 [Dimargaris cristalligena]|nr:hypothetical protein H4R33_005378 [Dimargaris cristalligena]